MKKILFAICMFFGFALATSAQASTKVSDTKQKVVKHEKSKHTGIKNRRKLSKSDGTPDMRYKINKAKKHPVGPTKKDGTADMRYKVNKKEMK